MAIKRLPVDENVESYSQQIVGVSFEVAERADEEKDNRREEQRWQPMAEVPMPRVSSVVDADVVDEVVKKKVVGGHEGLPMEVAVDERVDR